jgi:hypothetical protein
LYWQNRAPALSFVKALIGLSDHVRARQGSRSHLAHNAAFPGRVPFLRTSSARTNSPGSRLIGETPGIDRVADSLGPLLSIDVEAMQFAWIVYLPDTY